MSTIRPPIFPTPQPQAQPTAPTRNSAQQAFFAAAMGRPTAAQAQPQVQGQPQAPAAPAQRMPASLPADPPQRILRPGSILDIRV
ncbi:hypothetical protein LJR164_000237 [Phenylobacterium sp. LjRoot164]|uniref:hypothetical protein n=1 Tax=unclassified Phenylobacterium TaxID=2640670 RepID=UPI003ECD7D68